MNIFFACQYQKFVINPPHKNRFLDQLLLYAIMLKIELVTHSFFSFSDRIDLYFQDISTYLESYENFEVLKMAIEAK